MYPVITIICGLPKSGKTSYRKQHFADTVPVVDEAQFKADTSKTPYEQHKEVIDMVIERTVQELSTTGKDVIVEGCFVNPTDRRALIRRLKYYATLRCIYIKTPARLCMYRNNRTQNREVSNAVIRKLYSFTEINPSVNEGFQSVKIVENGKELK